MQPEIPCCLERDFVENDKHSKNKEERVITCYEEYVITNE
jgi:hypothetical protein